MKQIVAIDGPSGSGKSTVAAMLATKLGYMHLDTGAMYRAVALAAALGNIPYDDAKGLDELCEQIRIEMRRNEGVVSVYLNGQDVTEKIRSPEMSLGSSAVSAVSEVRSHMVRLQREIGSSGGIVAEGRDMGSVVFPDTPAKFYLDASPEERARRRWLQLKEMGIDEAPEKVRREMDERDQNDTSREHSPLKKADDAIIVDTTGMSVDQVIEKLADKVKELEESGA
ncbi:MAG: (d)CMP kinase [bacterium]|nr:(d)CMP kinase [bacterium]MDT8366005.1 (d)CMP kinase [bacterium]